MWYNVGSSAKITSGGSVHRVPASTRFVRTGLFRNFSRANRPPKVHCSSPLRVRYTAGLRVGFPFSSGRKQPDTLSVGIPMDSANKGQWVAILARIRPLFSYAYELLFHNSSVLRMIRIAPGVYPLKITPALSVNYGLPQNGATKSRHPPARADIRYTFRRLASSGFP